jgi:rubrerythrin
MRGEADNNPGQETLKALQMALQMEIEGKDFYSKAARNASNDTGRQLLGTLASEEDYHRKVFSSIFDAISQKNHWPDVSPKFDGGQELKSILSAIINKGGKVAPLASELEAVSAARQMEARTYDFYQQQRKRATDPSEAEFYDKLCLQEQQHALALTDYEEMLQNPAGWFVKKEHPTLD